MPMNRKLYPNNWEEIALQIKTAANWTCQECDRPCRKLGESIEDFAVRLADEYDPNESYWMPQLYEDVWDEETGGYGTVLRAQRFTLTVAHLNHCPEDCSLGNLKALCAPCHCRYDLSQMGRKKRLKAERAGQLNLFDRPLEVEYAS